MKRITSLGAEVEVTTIILEAYESFTQQIANPAIRQKLEEVEKEKRHECPEYMQLKDAADDFSKALHCWLVQKYYEDDLIHHTSVLMTLYVVRHTQIMGNARPTGQVPRHPNPFMSSRP